VSKVSGVSRKGGVKDEKLKTKNEKRKTKNEK
jgi:hypothetical protein